MIDHNEPSFCWFAYRFKLLYFVFGCVSCLVWLMLMLMVMLMLMLMFSFSHLLMLILLRFGICLRL